MTSATATARYPLAATAVAIAASIRPRCDAWTTSRGAAWRPRGSGGAGDGGAGIAARVYAPGTHMFLRERHVRVGIIGAGFAGLGAAIRLKREGVDDFVVWERDADVGGTWWANTYPGCQCDIPSHLYSFSFAPNPE